MMDKNFNPELMEFRETTHEYWYAGKRFYSVSEVKDSLGLSGNYEAVDPYYANRGQRVHEFCRMMEQNIIDWDEVEDEELSYVLAWQNFLKDTGFKSSGIEKIMCIPILELAGTEDRIGTIENEMFFTQGRKEEIYIPTGSKCRIDIKTSKQRNRVWELQLGGYELLDSESADFNLTIQLLEDQRYIPYLWKNNAKFLFLNILTAFYFKVNSITEEKLNLIKSEMK